MTLAWIFNWTTQLTTPRETWLLFLETCRDPHPHHEFCHPCPSSPLWTLAHSWGERCWACWCLNTTWVGAPPSQGPTVPPHSTVLLRRAGLLSLCQYPALQTQETMRNVLCTFSGRTVAEQPSHPTTSGSAREPQRRAEHSHTHMLKSRMTHPSKQISFFGSLCTLYSSHATLLTVSWTFSWAFPFPNPCPLNE